MIIIIIISSTVCQWLVWLHADLAPVLACEHLPPLSVGGNATVPMPWCEDGAPSVGEEGNE